MRTPMLGVNLEDLSQKILEGKTWRMSEKIDGVRRLFYKAEDGQVTAYSRTGIEDPWLDHIFEFMERPDFPCGYIYDCELVDRDSFIDRIPSFELRQITSAKASQQYPDNKKDLIAVCFDIFKPDGDLTPAYERDRLLYKVFQRSSYKFPILRVPVYGCIEGADLKAISTAMQGLEARDGEGIMLLDMGSPYVPGRTRSLIKVKRRKEFEGQIVDIIMAEPGTKIEGTVAAVVCNVPGCTVPVKIGSGFTNDERREMAENPPLGRWIEIDAFSYSQNKDGAISLNLPIFNKFKGENYATK